MQMKSLALSIPYPLTHKQSGGYSFKAIHALWMLKPLYCNES